MIQTLFIHIPRTAGTSMNVLAEKSVPSYQDLANSLRPDCNMDANWTTTQHVSIPCLLRKNTFTQEWLESNFRFAFVRNPWDRLLSLHRHLKGYRLNQKRKRESNTCLCNFSSFLRAVEEGSFVKPVGKLCTDDFSQANPQIEWLWSGIDFVGRYENLEDDWEELCKRIGMPHKKLPRENRSKGEGSYQDQYNQKTRDMVATLYAEEIERFGYTFGGD